MNEINVKGIEIEPQVFPHQHQLYSCGWIALESARAWAREGKLDWTTSELYDEYFSTNQPVARERAVMKNWSIWAAVSWRGVKETQSPVHEEQQLFREEPVTGAPRYRIVEETESMELAYLARQELLAKASTSTVTKPLPPAPAPIRQLSRFPPWARASPSARKHRSARLPPRIGTPAPGNSVAQKPLPPVPAPMHPSDRPSPRVPTPPLASIESPSFNSAPEPSRRRTHHLMRPPVNPERLSVLKEVERNAIRQEYHDKLADFILEVRKMPLRTLSVLEYHIILLDKKYDTTKALQAFRQRVRK
ncbi:hypothetical protein F5B19DRAFT_489965 [Rostrohypoxylon terebratum]|nr:hypothetical protein F5B19DRAFT_489965 [Rostrohypoxylon terebratum]